MFTFYRKYYKTMFDIAVIVATILLIMWLFSLLYRIAAPVFFAFVFFAMFEPLARFLHRKGIKKSIATALSMLIFLIVLSGIAVGGGMIFFNQIQALSEKIPVYFKIVQEEVVRQTEYLTEQYQALPEEWSERVRQYAATAAEKAANFSTWFLGFLLSALSSVSNFVINLLIGLILSYFLSVEIDLWKRVAREKTPKTFKTAFYFLRDNVLKGIGAYLKAQGKLIFLTFAVIFAALLMLGVRNAFSIAVLAAVFDLLPLLGVSTVFLPWIIYLVVIGNYTLAIWLTVLLAVVILLRQILEPKIVGDSLGVSAFTMLSFMIVSLSLFGVAGLVLSPILIILVKELYQQGYIQQWIRAPEDY